MQFLQSGAPQVGTAQSVTEGFGSGIGFLFSPRAAIWLRVSAGTVSIQGGGPVPFLDAYEMLLFSQDRECRWLRTSPAGIEGEWVNLEEGSATGTGFIAGVEQKRILEGKPTPIAGEPDWVKLHSSRYASVAVPIAWDDRAEVVALSYREYESCDEHGNIDIAEIRYLRLSTHLRTDLYSKVHTPESYKGHSS